MATQTKFNDDMQERILKGVDELADAVSLSLGPRSRFFGIARGVPNQNLIYERIILKDGVSIAKSIDPEEPFENFGAFILKEAAQKQVDQVGDGTTVTVILARALLKESIKIIRAGNEPMELREGFESGTKKLVKKLDELATPVNTLEQKIQVATISAEDRELGKLIAETIHDGGVDGVVTVEESKGAETFVETQEGMQIDRGYASPYFVTDTDNMVATLEKVKVLITDQKVDNLAELGVMFEGLGKITNKLMIIAVDFSEQALALLVENKLRGSVQVLAIKAPSFAPHQNQILEDIAILSGANFISSTTGKNLKDTVVEDLGEFEYVSSDRSATVMTGGKGEKEAFESRIDQLRVQLKKEGQGFDKEKLRERLGKLTGKISVIRVGGATEVEMKERKERVIDAVEATKAAIKEGIVAGGEVIYLQLLNELDDKILGEKVLREVLKQPFRQLLTNAGFDAGEKLALLMPQAQGFGFDVTDGMFKDMIKEGIVDPVMVSKRAIENAVSVVITLALLGGVNIPILKDGKY